MLFGVGATRLSAAEWGTRTLAPAQTVASYSVGVDVPVAIFAQGSIVVGMRSAFVPKVSGGDATTWNLQLGFQRWPKTTDFRLPEDRH